MTKTVEVALKSALEKLDEARLGLDKAELDYKTLLINQPVAHTPSDVRRAWMQALSAQELRISRARLILESAVDETLAAWHALAAHEASHG